MFVFYDTETTGTNVAYDQILQFAAILTDDRLHEVDRFDIRCQLLPWVVPSPSALLVTGTDVDRLTDPQLPTFFDMMVTIRTRLVGWGPATFVGYNSMRFDEPFLQRAFWQALLPSYFTVTNGNSRLDLLPIVRATAHFFPGTLALPLHMDGRTSFKLDQLVPLNGFDSHLAHDALGDVEGTIFIARLLFERTPNLWHLLSTRAPKTKTVSILSFGQPVLMFQQVGGQPTAWFGQRIDQENGRTSHATIAVLGYDWRSAASSSDIEDQDAAGIQQALRRIALNKGPVVFTLDEAESLCGIAPAHDELLQSRFLNSDTKYCAELVERFGISYDYSLSAVELEELIFDGFPPKADESLLEAFHEADWSRRLEIARTFDDKRLRRLAMRNVYLSASYLMLPEERERIRGGISRRLTPSVDEPHRWRSISDALTESALIRSEGSRCEEIQKIESWLVQRHASATL